MLSWSAHSNTGSIVISSPKGFSPSPRRVPATPVNSLFPSLDSSGPYHFIGLHPHYIALRGDVLRTLFWSILCLQQLQDHLASGNYCNVYWVCCQMNSECHSRSATEGKGGTVLEPVRVATTLLMKGAYAKTKSGLATWVMRDSTSLEASPDNNNWKSRSKAVIIVGRSPTSRTPSSHRGVSTVYRLLFTDTC